MKLIISFTSAILFAVLVVRQLQDKNILFPLDHELNCAASSVVHSSRERASINSEVFWQLDPKQHKNLLDALHRFKKGEIGKSCRLIKLKGRSALKIHKLLIDLGFRHQRVPLAVNPITKPNTYWLRSGEQKNGFPNPNEMLPMDIYDHRDGCMIRVKAWGIPDQERKTIRSFPHATKSVVFDNNEKCSFLVFNCHLDTSWDNEAFKVSDSGKAIPKSPAPSDGFGIPKATSNEQEKKDFVDTIMDEAHINLPVTFSHCPIN